MKLRICLIWLGLLTSVNALSDETQSVDTTHIRASKELPKVLYVVPWKDITNKDDTEQKLVLHNFFGDLYDPILPDEIKLSSVENSITSSNK